MTKASDNLVERLTAILSERHLPGTRNGPVTEPGELAAYIAERLGTTRIEKLRAALSEISDFKPTEGEGDPHSQIAVFAKETARAALTQSEGA
jgi:hypothetical protein